VCQLCLVVRKSWLTIGWADRSEAMDLERSALARSKNTGRVRRGNSMSSDARSFEASSEHDYRGAGIHALFVYPAPGAIGMELRPLVGNQRLAGRVNREGGAILALSIVTGRSIKARVGIRPRFGTLLRVV